MNKKTALILLLSGIATACFSQKDFKTYFGAGYGIENRIGFRGVSLHAEGEVYLFNHIDGLVSLQYFHSSHVPRWNATENEGAYFRQATASAKIQYSSGAETGTGILANIAAGIRMGKTHHFESGKLVNGEFTEHRYATEKLKGNGVILGIGYGFKFNEKLTAKMEFSHYAFGLINDLQTISLKMGF
ncbi:MAG: hypothetical protein SFU87_06535 [Chitinophagaceae bacterium]|nr:hypothetical protein [Chitinophagaceae bacterium]